MDAKIQKGVKVTLWIVGVVIVLAAILSPIKGFYNTEVDLRNRFDQKMEERVAFYNKMFQTIQSKTEIALKNDESFRENVNIIMQGHTPPENVMWQWVQQVNPNANYDAVADLYQNLANTVAGEREGFFRTEKMLQDIKMQHINHLQKFPNNIYNAFFNRKPLEYTPIQVDTVKQVFETGVEPEADLGLTKKSE